jgi:O-antigen/teichoic acid export membrane protein
VWSLGIRIAAILASVCVTPILTRNLGPEQFGLWALANTLTSYLAFADLAMGTASTRFAALAHARDDDRGEATTIGTALVVTCVSASLVLALVLFLARPLAAAFVASDAIQGEAATVLRWSCLAVLGTLLTGVLNTPQLVRMKWRPYACVTLVFTALQSVLLAAVGLEGGGPTALMIVTACVACATALTHGVVAWKLQPQLLPLRADAATGGQLLTFALPLAASALVGALIFHGEKALLARFSGLEQMGFYAVGFALAQLLDLGPSALLLPLLPAMTRLVGAGQRGALANFHETLVRGGLLLAPPAALLVVALAQPIVAIWAGPLYVGHAERVVWILAVGYFVNVLAHVSRALLTAEGRTDVIAKVHAAQVLPYLALAWFLISSFGAEGAALAWSTRATFECLIVWRAAKRISNIQPRPFRRGAKAYLAGLVSLTVACLAPVLAGVGLAWTAAMALTGAAGYAILVWQYSLDSQEKIRLKALAGGFLW